MMRQIMIIWGLLIVVLCGHATASARISGRIIEAQSRRPIAGVQVGVGYGSKEMPGAAMTATDGSFSFTLDEVFPGYTPRLPEVTLMFRKTGYHPENHISACSPRGKVDCTELEIELGVIDPAPGISEEERRVLDQAISRKGLTLYLLPYEIRGGGGVIPEVDIEWLAEGIHRRVNSRLQQLRVKDGGVTSLPAVGLLPLSGVAVHRTDTERLDAIGRYINALALVGGRGKAISGDDSRVLLTSHFYVVPSTVDFRAGALYVDDLVPAEVLGSPLLFEALSDEWALHTLIALSVKELKSARENRDIKALKEIRAYLIAQRSEYGQEEAAKVSRIEELLELVDKELHVLQNER